MSNRAAAAFAERLNHLLLRNGNGGTVYECAKFLASTFSVSPQAGRKWLTGKGLPQTEKLGEIADYFGVSLDFLLGRHDQVTPPGAFNRDDRVIDSPGDFFGRIKATDKLIVRPLHNRSVESEVFYLVDFLGVRQVMQLRITDAGLVATVEDCAGRRQFEITPSPAVEHLLAHTLGEVIGVIRTV